ncbi:MAG: site-2 protease family protein, partial [Gemmatimonadaceae bacterium]
GHYVAARRYRVDASPPFFIPFPWQINILGTMGAYIRLRSPVLDRRTLFDIGAAGPLAGLIVALPLLGLGLAWSTPSVNAPDLALAHQYILIEGHPFFLGDSLLLALVRQLVAPDGVLRLHPLAVAGWVGVLVTMLNMLPLAQLDGGHVTFALFGRAQTWIARAFWVALLFLGVLWWGWWIWAALGLILGRGRLSHPRILSPDRDLGPNRRRVGYLALAIFVVTFMPVPIAVV